MAAASWQKSRYTQYMHFLSNLTSFLRSFGLEIISVLIRARIKSPSGEPKKPILRKSRWLALSRCAVHILPIIVSIGLVILNLLHIYIGDHIRGDIFTNSDNTNLAMLQVTAKIQELLVVGSTGNIVFHIIRNELIDGDGLPLGLIGAGLQFSGLSFLWSPAFLCSVPYRARLWRKILVFLSLIVASALAVAAGPASAVLMVPRQQDWQAGGSPFYLQGSSLDIWPDRLTFDENRDLSICQNWDATDHSVCPSGGLNALIEHYELIDPSRFLATGALPYQGTVAGATYFYKIDSPDQQFPTQIAIGDIRTEGGNPCSFLVQPHAATIVYQKVLTNDWFDAIRNQSGTSFQNIARYVTSWNIKSEVRTQVPFASVQCTLAQNMSIDSEVDIEYPILPFERRQTRSRTTNISKQDIQGRPIWTSWIPLESKTWQNISTGLLVAFPDPDSAHALAVGCSIQAAWMPAGILHDPSTSYAFNPYGLEFTSARPITIDKSWLEILSPIINPPSNVQGDWSMPDNNSNRQTSLDLLIAKSRLQTASPTDNKTTAADAWNSQTFPIGGNQTTLLESLVASLFVDGLSRTGSALLFIDPSSLTVPSNLRTYSPSSHYFDKILQGGYAQQPPSAYQPHTALRVEITIPKAFCLKATSSTDYLAITIILVHVLLALLHSAYCVSSGVSSSAWDSMSELLTLAQNSRPANQLFRNTSAGIQMGKTYRHKARIRVTRADTQQEDQLVELLYDDEGPGSESQVEVVGPEIYDEHTGAEEADAMMPDTGLPSLYPMKNSSAPQAQVRPTATSRMISESSSTSMTLPKEKDASIGHESIGLVQVDMLYS